jgi:thiazole synthase ThiGH ThiG subunit
MEMGFDGVLLKNAIALVQDLVAMARAFANAAGQPFWQQVAD